MKSLGFASDGPQDEQETDTHGKHPTHVSTGPQLGSVETLV